MKRTFLILLALVTMVCWANEAMALSFYGSSGNLAARPQFLNVGGNLQITLTNTSTVDINEPGNVLTGLFFDVVAVNPFTTGSALLAVGSIVYYDNEGQPAGGVVGGEWRYRSAITTILPLGASEAVFLAGFGLNGAEQAFPGPDLAPPVNEDGVNYEILPKGWVAAGDNGGMTGSGGLIKNSVVFTLSGIPVGFNPSTANITNVSFQYGTGLNEPNVPGTVVPLPGAVLLLGVGLPTSNQVFLGCVRICCHLWQVRKNLAFSSKLCYNNNKDCYFWVFKQRDRLHEHFPHAATGSLGQKEGGERAV